MVVLTTSLPRGRVEGNQVPERYHDIVRPHVESFDYFLGEGISTVLQNVQPTRVRLPPSPA